MGKLLLSKKMLKRNQDQLRKIATWIRNTKGTTMTSASRRIKTEIQAMKGEELRTKANDLIIGAILGMEPMIIKFIPIMIAEMMVADGVTTTEVATHDVTHLGSSTAVQVDVGVMTNVAMSVINPNVGPENAAVGRRMNVYLQPAAAVADVNSTPTTQAPLQEQIAIPTRPMSARPKRNLVTNQKLKKRAARNRNVSTDKEQLIRRPHQTAIMKRRKTLIVGKRSSIKRRQRKARSHVQGPVHMIAAVEDSFY